MYTLKLKGEIMFLSLICIGIISNSSSTTDFPDRKSKPLYCLTLGSKTQKITYSPSQLLAHYLSYPPTAGPKFLYHRVLLSIFIQL